RVVPPRVRGGRPGGRVPLLLGRRPRPVRQHPRLLDRPRGVPGREPGPREAPRVERPRGTPRDDDLRGRAARRGAHRRGRAGAAPHRARLRADVPPRPPGRHGDRRVRPAREGGLARQGGPGRDERPDPRRGEAAAGRAGRDPAALGRRGRPRLAGGLREGGGRPAPLTGRGEAPSRIHERRLNVTERPMSERWVYSFGGGKADGDASMKSTLGGKGANLAEMTNLGIPVPPGFTITTGACAHFSARHEWPDGLEQAVDAALAKLEQTFGKRFGDASDPLLVSVRSGAAVSMPGMM